MEQALAQFESKRRSAADLTIGLQSLKQSGNDGKEDFEHGKR